VFDVLRRYLILQGYKVRFVRNITDVGHLVGDADEGEDKLAKQAKVEQLEPMEVAQTYTDAYNSVMDRVNVLKLWRVEWASFGRFASRCWKSKSFLGGSRREAQSK
jgi:cysteinyl-tRNA synthetase